MTRVPITLDIESAKLIVEIVTGGIEVHPRTTSSRVMRSIGKAMALLVPIAPKKCFSKNRKEK
ncbi:MAG: hypothetical protein WCF23_14180 [Candidatus Nitrosopolaris sp.]